MRRIKWKHHHVKNGGAFVVWQSFNKPPAYTGVTIVALASSKNLQGYNKCWFAATQTNQRR
jgi:hypothetical protein